MPAVRAVGRVVVQRRSEEIQELSGLSAEGGGSDAGATPRAEEGSMKPCPFCSANRTIELWDTFDAGHIAWAYCETCGARGPSRYSEISADTAISEAVAAWDRRVR